MAGVATAVTDAAVTAVGAVAGVVVVIAGGAVAAVGAVAAAAVTGEWLFSDREERDLIRLRKPLLRESRFFSPSWELEVFRVGRLEK